MRKRTSRILAGIGGLAIMLGVSACTTGNGASSDGATTGTITVWDLQNDPKWVSTFDDASAAFEKEHPGVKIKRVQQPADTVQVRTLLQAAAQAKKGPDVVMTLPWGDILAIKDALAPIQDYISKDTRKSLSGWEGTQFDGNTYGVPIGLQGVGIAFNKQIFTAAGLDPDNPPQTLDELISACGAIKKAGYIPLAGGNKEGYLTGWIYSALWPGVADESAVKKSLEYTQPLNAKPVTTTVEAGMKLLQDGCFSSDMPSTPFYPDGFQPFTDGKAGMTFAIYSQVQPFGAATNAATPGIGADNLGYLPTLKVDRTPSFVPAGPQNVWAVTSFSPMKKLSAEFAQELESAKYQQQRFDDLGLFPNNSGVSWDKYEKANPGAASIVAALKKLPTSLMAHSMQDSKTNDIFQTQIELAMLGKTTVKEALDAAEKSRIDQRETLFPTK